MPGGAQDGGGIPPEAIYKTAVEEYRFQAQYNWSRTQYFLAFNAAILTAGSAVASRPGKSAALVFLIGVVGSVLAALAVRTQHDYYRAARNRLQRIEDAHHIPLEHRIDTTTTMGGRSGRTVSVNQVAYLLFAVLAVSDVIGAVIVLVRK